MQLLNEIQDNIYEQVKTNYPGHVVLHKCGSFYEVFGDDAKIAAKFFDLPVIRPKIGGEPMAIIPYDLLDACLYDFIRSGHRVAIC